MWEDKETTAPDPSVAPDGEQPSALARTDSIATFEEANKQFGKMRIFSMPELMDTHFPSRPCIIENLLPAGTYLLAGAPKIGKSFLVLQMAYQVSAGEPFLGFPSRQGTVLYLALEDTYERLQKRLAQMTERDSPDLVLSVLADTLEEDLLEQLESFLFEYPETVLVIIDTLQRIRGRTPDNGSYAADYDTIAKLKAFSDQRGIALLLVHHTRKEGAEDVFDTISGTNGILGRQMEPWSCIRTSARVGTPSSMWWDVTSRRCGSACVLTLLIVSGKRRRWKRSCSRSRRTRCWNFFPGW